MLYSFNNIIEVYKKFSVINTPEERKILSSDDFKTKLFHLLFYTSPQTSNNGYKNYPYQVANYEDNATTKRITGDTRWVKVMSWWKTFNTLEKHCLKLQKHLINNTVSNSKDIRTITQLKNNLYFLLNKMNARNSLAEIAIISLYVDLTQNVPNIDSWMITQENSLTGLEDNFFQRVENDRARMHFIKECSYHSLNLLFNIMRYITEDVKAFSITETIRQMVKSCIEHLFKTIKQYLAEDDNDNDVRDLTENALKRINNFFSTVDGKKTDTNFYEIDFVILTTAQILFELIKLMAKKFQHLFYDSSRVITKKYISAHVLNTVVNGIILASKALEHDLLSQNLLLKVCDERNRLSIELSLDMSMKFAFIIVSSFKILNRNDKIFYLPYDYIRHDLAAFLNNVQMESKVISSEKIFQMDSLLHLKKFQEQLSQKLQKSLSNIAEVVSIANVLLTKTKYL